MREIERSLRPRTAVLWLVVAWLLLVAVVWAYTWRHGWAQSWTLALCGAVVGMWVWWLVWYPVVIVRTEGVAVINPLRRITVPWDALIQVETKYALTLITPQRKVSAWAAPAPGRQILMAANRQDLAKLPRTSFDHQRSVALGDLPRSLSGSAALEVRSHWEDLVVNGELNAGRAHEVQVDWIWHRALISTMVGLSLGALMVLFVAG